MELIFFNHLQNRLFLIKNHFELSKNSNNHFGIKCHRAWKGKKRHRYDEKNLPIQCFRAYETPEQSFSDHAQFLVNNQRYKKCFEKKCYKHWSKELTKAYYASNRKYDKQLIRIIERYGLQEFDKIG